MEVLHGIPVSTGIAIGKISIIKPKNYQIGTLKIRPEQRDAELGKFETALDAVLKKTDQFIEDYAQSEENREIFESQKMILLDPDLKSAIQALINDELLTVENAVSSHFVTLVQYFRNMENEFFAQRAIDFEDVSHILLDHLLEADKNDKLVLAPDVIVFAKEMTPSQVSLYAKANVKAICTEKGSQNSHSSILARAFGIPFIVAVPALLEKGKEQMPAIVDAQDGDIILDPTDEQMLFYKQKIEALISLQNSLKKIENNEATTASGKRIQLMANMEFTDELEEILKSNNDGIGLFRTEFLYLDQAVLPSEEKQFAIYKSIAEKLGDKPLIIRTFDLGGDKLSHVLNIDKEENPYLGCRGIRFSLKHKDIFRIQLRAILRASVYGNIKIMFPMIIGFEDMQEGRMFVRECISELEKEGKACLKTIEIGAMIETPSAALCAGSLAKGCDFFSIGTNDLVQYTLAVDRNNDVVAPYYVAYHPSVLALIRLTIEQAHLHGLKVSVCGEMASDPRYVHMLLAFGIDELSVNPKQFLSVKDSILHFDETAQKKYDQITSSSSLDEIRAILDK